MRLNRFGIGLGVILAFALGGLILPNLHVNWVGPRATAEPSESAARGGFLTPADVARLNPEEVYARAAALAGPSIVNIDTESRVRVRGFFDDDFFFGGGGPRYRRVAGAGSGVIVSTDGDIITNEHVVRGAERIRVTLPDGKSYPGKVLGGDPQTDVALVHIDGVKFPSANIGTVKDLVPGQLAVALGNPLGLRFTVTHGIVSALGRPMKFQERVYENLIQTDCAINPGNSGGALVDREGKVIGINTLVLEANGVGFAIPIDTAVRVAKELKQYGKVKRPWTGIFASAVTEQMRQYFQLESSLRGAFVEGIVQGSPADEAGLQRGDIVLELDGKPVRNDDDLRHATEKLKIGQKVTVKILRGDQRASGDMTIRESP